MILKHKSSISATYRYGSKLWQDAPVVASVFFAVDELVAYELSCVYLGGLLMPPRTHLLISDKLSHVLLSNTACFHYFQLVLGFFNALEVLLLRFNACEGSCHDSFNIILSLWPTALIRLLWVHWHPLTILLWQIRLHINSTSCWSAYFLRSYSSLVLRWIASELAKHLLNQLLLVLLIHHDI